MTLTEVDLDEIPLGYSREEWIKTFTYQFRDANGNLLYVGATQNVGSRLAQHYRTQPWREEIVHIEITMFDNPVLAKLAEMEQTGKEPPKYVKAGLTAPMVPYTPRRRKTAAKLSMVPDPPVPVYSTKMEPGSDEDLRLRILTCLNKMTKADPQAKSFFRGDVTRRVVDAIPRSQRVGNVRARITAVLDRMATDSRSPVVRHNRGRNPVNKQKLYGFSLREAK